MATIPKACASARTSNRNFRAVKVWDKREFKDLDDEVELGTRNIKLALRRLRKFARTGAPEELDLDGTIKGTAHKGYLDILMRPERHNAVKVLLFFDIGGSMDWHIKATEELFSAARTEFKHMEHFYFHNCLYERVWKENRRRFERDHADLGRAAHLSARLQGDLRRRRLDVALRDRGAGRLGRALSTRSRARPGWSASRAPIRPASGSTRCRRANGSYTHSIRMMRQLMGGRMYPLTLDGLDRAMRELVR